MSNLYKATMVTWIRSNNGAYIVMMFHNLLMLFVLSLHLLCKIWCWCHCASWIVSVTRQDVPSEMFHQSNSVQIIQTWSNECVWIPLLLSQHCGFYISTFIYLNIIAQFHLPTSIIRLLSDAINLFYTFFRHHVMPCKMGS